MNPGTKNETNTMKKKNQSLRILFTLAGIVGALSFFPGCETTAGVGRDMEAAGDAVEDSAQDTQGY